ncbi:MAG: hypothetical protein AAFO84_12460 [Cyanobacteria bacterium J06598_1]
MNAEPPSLLPTEANHFRGYYKPWFGIGLLILGGLNLMIVLRAILITGTFNSGIITGIASTVVGYLFLTRPYFAIAPNRLTIYNLIGSTVKRYPFKAFSNLQVEGSQLHIKDTEDEMTVVTGRKVNIRKWIIKSEDWKRLEAIANAKSH